MTSFYFFHFHENRTHVEFLSKYLSTCMYWNHLAHKCFPIMGFLRSRSLVADKPIYTKYTVLLVLSNFFDGRFCVDKRCVKLRTDVSNELVKIRRSEERRVGEERRDWPYHAHTRRTQRHCSC